MIEITSLTQYKDKSAALMLQFDALLLLAKRENDPAKRDYLFHRSAALIEENEQVAHDISALMSISFNKNFVFTDH